MLDYEHEFISDNETFDQKLQRREMFRNAYFTAYPEYWPKRENISPIFYIGMGRSGTVTTTNILNLCEEIVAYHEPQPRLWQFTQDIAKDPDNDKWTDVLWGAKRDLISVVSSLGYTYAECNGLSSVIMRAVLKTFPKARFIMVLRDMRDFVGSAINWGWYADNDRNQVGRIQQDDSEHDASYKCAKDWIIVNGYALELTKDLPSNQIYYIPFQKYIDHDIDYIKTMFTNFNLTPPKDKELNTIFTDPRFRNAGRSKLKLQSNSWEEFSYYEDFIQNEFNRRVGEQINGNDK